MKSDKALLFLDSIIIFVVIICSFAITSVISYFAYQHTHKIEVQETQPAIQDPEWCLIDVIQNGSGNVVGHKSGTYNYQFIQTVRGIEVYQKCDELFVAG